MSPFLAPSTKPTSQPGVIDVMDPFHSYASRFITWDGENNDINVKDLQSNPILRAIIVEDPRSERSIEFNVRVNAISAVSPYIKTLFDLYPTKRRLGIESATADDMQILLKYMHTGIYNSSDISHRHRNKHDIVFRHIDFYLFCQKLGYTSLVDVVRNGIQANLDLMTWSPVPSREDSVLLHPKEGSSEAPSLVPLLMSLFSACESYYPKIKGSDPIQKNLLIYSYHLWKQLGCEWGVSPKTQHDSKLWDDMKEYRMNLGSVDIYHQVPEYRHNSISVTFIVCIWVFYTIFICAISYFL